jgi:calcium binding protein 39
MPELRTYHFAFCSSAQCRKDVAQVVSSLLRKSSGSRHRTAEIFASDPSIIQALLGGYDDPPIALNCGLMVREAARHEPLCRQLLFSDGFYRLFEHIDSPLFEVASDAFTTFKDALTKHKALVAEFLIEQYVRFFGCYSRLLSSGNYVTKRQSLKLLSDLLLDRANFKTMTRYISSADDFKQVMLLLRDTSKTIQFEAFHVFKIFVANPNRPKPIVDILVRNRERLVAFLQAFHADKEDEQFADEKAFLIEEVMAVAADEPADADAPQPEAAPPSNGGGIGGGSGIPRADGRAAVPSSGSGGGIPRADGRPAGGGIPRADGRPTGGGIPRADGRPAGGGIPSSASGGGGIPRADGRPTGGGIPRADGRPAGGGIPRANGNMR